MTTTDNLHHRIAIQDVLNRYARACDQRDWAAFDAVFAESVTVNYGGTFQLEGRPAVVDMIRSMLGGCGPTQHLLGNIDITLHGTLSKTATTGTTTANSACYVRAVHAGLGAAADTYYEVWAEYCNTLHRAGVSSRAICSSARKWAAGTFWVRRSPECRHCR